MTTREQPDKRVKRYVMWYSLRRNGLPEDEILRDLERGGLGEFGSPRALYQQLANDKFPVCEVCGMTPEEPDHCEKLGRPRRRAKTDAEALVKLPPADAARDLFLDALEGLKPYTYSLDMEEAWLWGEKRYITAWVDRDVYKVIHRAECSKEEWEELCEHHGANSKETDALYDVPTVESGPAGLNRTPPEDLAALITAYVFSPDGLKRRPLEPLLEALHPDPTAADMKQLRKKIEELKKAADHVAMIVRGGTVERSRPIEEVSRSKHFLAWHIQELDSEGISSDEEMLERLREWWGEEMDDFTPKDIRWLRSLKLPRPE
jgi:hypothetical protein